MRNDGSRTKYFLLAVLMRSSSNENAEVVNHCALLSRYAGLSGVLTRKNLFLAYKGKY